jgi:Ca2+:H+ antiporter
VKAPGLFSAGNLLNLLLLFIPAAAVLQGLHAEPVWVFFAAALAIIPLAGWMGRATERLADQLGGAAGGLLNATFGNAAELMIALMALRRGLHEVVKASLTGSIIGNILLVFGVSALAGGLKFPAQRFSRAAAGTGVSLLMLSAIGLVVPALFHQIAGGMPENREHTLSLTIAAVLFAAYLLSLLFSLRTHRHLYLGETGEPGHPAEAAGWSRKKSLLILLGATAAVAAMSELLVGAVEPAAHSLGLSDLFIGVIVVAVIGNAAEHSTAVLMALKNKMDLSLHIAVGSSLQIALFVAPLLVFASRLFGSPLDLIFSPFEVLAVVLAVIVLSMIVGDGESNWLEGAMLVAVYLILAITFYFLPVAAGAAV